MSHIFDVHHKNRLNSEERQRLLTPRETLVRLGYNEGMTFADIGCGTGLFTFPAAKIGGLSAKQYAVDISSEMLEDVRQQAAAIGNSSIETVLSEPYDFKLKDSTADFVLICTVLHEIDDKARFLSEARRIIKPNGIIAIIDFNEKDFGFGPPMTHRLPSDQVCGLLSAAGFSSAETSAVGDAFYAVTAVG